MLHRTLLSAFLLCSCATTQEVRVLRAVEHGRVEQHGDLRVLRVWGTPEQRGTAHGQLLGKEIFALMRGELTARFGEQKDLLAKARLGLMVLVRYPKRVRDELRAMYKAARALEGADKRLPAFDRDIDFSDVLLVNAMDILAMMGCSGFTVAGDQVEGGGVLTGRNFDWPLTGTFLVDNCILMVQHPDDGKAFATVGWAGYLGAVTGVNEAGVAVFLHVGDSRGMPKAALPTAVAAREILQQAGAGDVFAVADKVLAGTSPPGGFLTRVVNSGAAPDAVARDGAVRVFEADTRALTHRDKAAISVVTNHFLSRKDEEGPVSGDSSRRERTIRTCLELELGRGDKKVSVAEAWGALESVERHGSFATLHSVVFRHAPWVFELRLGTARERGGVRGAPGGARRFALTRKAVFAPVPAAAATGPAAAGK